MIIPRDIYVDRLIKRRGNGLAKVITGIRRCGKSYLLFTLYRDYLLASGIPADHIIGVDLDGIENRPLRDALTLYQYVRGLVVDGDPYYVFLDEVQFVDGFADVVNGLMRLGNVDVYVTGSNSRLLSTDVLTEFRGRGDEVCVRPLSFSEYAPAHGGSTVDAWKDFYTFGGLPLILSQPDDEMKANYLSTQLATVYLRDVCDRNGIHHEDDLGRVLDVLASSTGSLTNPAKIANTFASAGTRGVTNKTVRVYIDYLADAFLIQEAQRFDVKGRKYIDTPLKYYFTDVGLRNARLGFRQQEENHIMENVLFNELLVRGYSVDVGVVNTTETVEGGKRRRKQLEIDFIARKGDDQCYVQSAFAMDSEAKAVQETRPLTKVDDSFRKFIIVKDDIKTRRDNRGIVTMGLFEFLLDEKSLLK